VETQYFKVGKIVSAFGLNGELVLEHSLGKTTFKGIEAIFIEDRKESFLPYFVQSAHSRNATELLLQLENITTREAARKLVQKEVWLTADDFKKHASKSAPISLLGYHLIHQNEDIGEINEIIEQPHQVLCKIDMEGNEVLIPLHGETLQRVDNKAKKVYVILPDGLLDIYR